MVAFQFNAMGRSFLSQFFVANDRCTTCRLCERTCPVGAIRIARGAGARPVWKLSCESCNRCINLCPERAIVTSWGRMAVAALLQVGVIWIAIALAGRSGFAWPIRAILIAAVSTAGVIMVLPPVVRLIDKIPVLRRVIAYGFNKNWNQYTAPGFHPPNDPGHKKTAR